MTKTTAPLSIFAGFVLAVLLLPGCGGGDGAGPASPGVGDTHGRYGSLTLSGTGTDIAGSAFNGVSRIGPTTMSQWYNVDIGSGLTYPSVVLIVATDTQTGQTMVDFNHMISNTQASGEWVVLAAPPGTVVTTSTGVTFMNLELGGYGSTPTTRLTLNGTLTF